MKRILSLVLLCLLSTTAMAQENWSHWRGPTGNGISETAKPPIEWDGEKNVKWKVAIEGKGSGSPVIWQDKVFIVTAVTEGEEAGGGQAQGRQQGRRGRGRGRGRSGKPTKETAFQLLCFNRSNGDLIWEKTAAKTVPHEGLHAQIIMPRLLPVLMGNTSTLTLAVEEFFAIRSTATWFGSMTSLSQ